MKKLSILIIAAMAMISCGNTYTAKTVELTNQNDSMNYALGVVNGAQMKMYQLRNDSSMETVTEFIDALQRGYDGAVEELSEAGNVGRNTAPTIQNILQAVSCQIQFILFGTNRQNRIDGMLQGFGCGQLFEVRQSSHAAFDLGKVAAKILKHKFFRIGSFHTGIHKTEDLRHIQIGKGLF